MKEIKMSLSTASISKAIKELKAYQKWVESKTTEFAERLATELGILAEQGFGSAYSEHLIVHGLRKANVSVDIQGNGNVLMVVASGEDAIWCEFGTGMWYNGNIGGSPHPKGAELGYTIGGYGNGHGKQETWVFKDSSGTYTTHGIPAQMPFYRAVMDIAERYVAIAREVFK